MFGILFIIGVTLLLPTSTNVYTPRMTPTALVTALSLVQYRHYRHGVHNGCQIGYHVLHIQRIGGHVG